MIPHGGYRCYVHHDDEPTDAPATRIVTAAARLLADGGTAAVTTRAVAREAGVQAPTIYRHFGDKDGLLDAVAEQVMATYVARKQGTDETDDPVADLRAAWERHLDFGLANPDLTRLLLAPRHAGSPASTAGLEVLRSRVRRVASAGLLAVPEERAVRMVHAAGTGLVLTLLSTPPAGRDAALPASVMDAVLGAVLATDPVADTSPAAVAVTFGTVLADLPGLSDAERALMAEWLARALAGSAGR